MMTKKGKISVNNINNSSHIPLELITEILSWLPAKSVLRFKSVSSSWYHLIKELTIDPKFIKLHLRRSHEANPDTYLVEIVEQKPRLHSLTATRNQQYLKYDYNVTDYTHPITNFINTDRFHCHLGSSCDGSLPPHVLGSCDGILCFTSWCYTKTLHPLSRESSYNVGFFLYNPTTRDFRRLPPLDPTQNMYPNVCAFGYDCVSDDYKVLAFFESYAMTEERSMLYSLKADAWEDIPNTPPHLFEASIGAPVLANNSFYWINRYDYLDKHIICFDLSTRRYYEIPHPDQNEDCCSELTILRGQLCMVTYKLDIWMLNKHDDDHNNSFWTRIFHHQSGQLNNLDITCCPRFSLSFGCLKDGHSIILAICKNGDLQKTLICCDLESNEVREIEATNNNLDRLKSILEIQPWVGSFVPLH